MNVALRRFWIQITADRRRFGTLCVVVAVGLLLWARLIVVNNMPRTALATENAVTSEKPADKRSKKGSTAPVAAANKTPVRIDLNDVPNRDPFVISQKYFPRPTPPAEPIADADKSGLKLVEEADREGSRLESRLQACVARFKLEVAVAGSMAVINGKTYRTGDVVRDGGSGELSFRLEQVGQRSVILMYEDRQFEIAMSSPGE